VTAVDAGGLTSPTNKVALVAAGVVVDLAGCVCDTTVGEVVVKGFARVRWSWGGRGGS